MKRWPAEEADGRRLEGSTGLGAVLLVVVGLPRGFRDPPKRLHRQRARRGGESPSPTEVGLAGQPRNVSRVDSTTAGSRLSSVTIVDSIDLRLRIGYAPKTVFQPRDATPGGPHQHTRPVPEDPGAAARLGPPRPPSSRPLGGLFGSILPPKRRYALLGASMVRMQGAALRSTAKIGRDRVPMGITGDLNAWLRRKVDLAPPMPTLIVDTMSFFNLPMCLDLIGLYVPWSRYCRC